MAQTKIAIVALAVALIAAACGGGAEGSGVSEECQSAFAAAAAAAASDGDTEFVTALADCTADEWVAEAIRKDPAAADERTLRDYLAKRCASLSEHEGPAISGPVSSGKACR